MERRLDGIAVGQSAVIVGVEAESVMRRRLLDIGFTPGAVAACLFAGPSGEPRAYGVRGAVIALRKKDAHGITVEY